MHGAGCSRIVVPVSPVLGVTFPRASPWCHLALLTPLLHSHPQSRQETVGTGSRDPFTPQRDTGETSPAAEPPQVGPHCRVLRADDSPAPALTVLQSFSFSPLGRC